MIQLAICLATGWRVLIAVGVLAIGSPLLFQLGPYATLKEVTGGRPLPEETVTTSAELRSFLTNLDQTERALYGRFQFWDVVNPVILAVATTLFLAWLLKRAGLEATAWRWTLGIPPAMAAADVLEDVVLWTAIVRYPEASMTTAALPFVTGLKFGLVVLVLLSIVTTIVAYLVLRRRPRGR